MAIKSIHTNKAAIHNLKTLLDAGVTYYAPGIILSYAA